MIDVKKSQIGIKEKTLMLLAAACSIMHGLLYSNGVCVCVCVCGGGGGGGSEASGGRSYSINSHVLCRWPVHASKWLNSSLLWFNLNKQ